MKKILLIFLLLIISWFSNAIYSITIYGTNTCGYTTSLRNDCIKNNIEFTFCNVEEINCYYDLKSVVFEFNLATDNYVDLPVVKIIIDGKKYAFIRPSIEKIKELILLSNTNEISINNFNNNIYIKGFVKSAEIFNLLGVRVAYYSNCNFIDINNLISGVYIIVVNKNVKYKFIKY